MKGIVRVSSPSRDPPYATHILNWAFGRFELIPFPSLDEDQSLRGVGLRLRVMGERGEVGRRVKKFADPLGAEVI